MRTLFLILLLASASAGADERPLQTREEIDFLLDHVRNGQLVFIRNGKDHDPEEAYKHMMAKYRHFDKKIHSTEDFIEYSATRSLISGRPYRVRLPDGSEREAAKYLQGLLAEFRASRLSAAEGPTQP